MLLTRILSSSALLFFAHVASAKKIDRIINQNEVTRIETVLSHDSMEGRKAFTKGIERAANFISSEMQAIGLQTFQNAGSYLQPFSLNRSSIKEVKVELDGNPVPDEKKIICVSGETSFSFTDKSGYKIVRIASDDNYTDKVRSALAANENTIVFVDSSFAGSFPKLNRYHMGYISKPFNIVFVLTGNVNTQQFSISIQQEITARTTSNVIGVLPGKSKANEYVIFSGHYDHLGYSRPDSTGDSLYNGADDDASGITAMLMLAKYYKATHCNERTILFTAFSAEELGTLGSEYFATTIDANKVVAMFNIEMIGTESKWGENSFYVTGFERSDMGTMMQKNLKKKKMKIYPDPYPTYKLFYRSDNASLASLGVPAHTISTSKMDNEPYYHKPADEIETLDLANMTEIIKGIATAANSIVTGKDTPSRIKPLKID